MALLTGCSAPQRPAAVLPAAKTALAARLGGPIELKSIVTVYSKRGSGVCGTVARKDGSGPERRFVYAGRTLTLEGEVKDRDFLERAVRTCPSLVSGSGA